MTDLRCSNERFNRVAPLDLGLNDLKVQVCGDYEPPQIMFTWGTLGKQRLFLELSECRALVAWLKTAMPPDETECNQAAAASSGADVPAPTPRGSLPNSLGTSPNCGVTAVADCFEAALRVEVISDDPGNVQRAIQKIGDLVLAPLGEDVMVAVTHIPVSTPDTSSGGS